MKKQKSPYIINKSLLDKVSLSVDNTLLDKELKYDILNRVSAQNLKINDETFEYDSMDRVRDTAVGIGRADDIYDMWKGFDSIKEFNKLLGYALSGLENGSWMFRKLRKGYTVIDIGITTTYRGMSDSVKFFWVKD